MTADWVAVAHVVLTALMLLILSPMRRLEARLLSVEKNLAYISGQLEGDRRIGHRAKDLPDDASG